MTLFASFTQIDKCFRDKKSTIFYLPQKFISHGLDGLFRERGQRLPWMAIGIKYIFQSPIEWVGFWYFIIKQTHFGNDSV